MYRRPGIKVTQEFVDLLPALAPFNLPNCIIGPAFQVVKNDNLGPYIGEETSYPYVKLNAGNVVDTSLLSDTELKDHQFPIAVKLTEIKVEQVAEKTTGSLGTKLTDFVDNSVGAFSGIVAGDEIEIFERTIEVLTARSNGSVNSTQRNTLVGVSASEYSSMVEGDSVVITGGTDVTPGTYSVLSKTDNQTLVLSANFYTGGSSAANVAYSIERTTGAENQGVYRVRSFVNNNQLILASTLEVRELPIAYRILRKIDSVTLTRDNQFVADESTIDLSADIQVNGKDVISAKVFADYRALRTDLSSSVKEFKSITDLQSVFGVDQIVPANTLAFALSIALNNTVTAVNGLALSSDYLSDERIAYQKSLDTLKKTNMYALAPMTQSPVIHQIFSTHVTQMSLPEIGKERVCILNTKLIEIETLVESDVTAGNRTIVNTKTNGIVILGSNSLQAPTATYASVLPGDKVVIVAGTGVVAGTYVVSSVTSPTQLLLTGFSATYNGADVAYYIIRDDGLEANGQIFYDEGADFLDKEVVAGDFLVVEAGTFKGKYKIVTVDSNSQITLQQIPGVVSNVGNLSYHVERKLSDSDVAAVMAGYAASFANRRAVITFPDVVKIPEGSQIKELPGFYFSAAIAALTTGLPTQQGFTNITVSGFLGFINGSERFDEEQLDTIASGGFMIFAQDVENAPLYVRHQLTTDTSSIKFQEYSLTKNVDYVAKFLRQSFAPFIGKYNIVDSTIDEMKITAGAVIKFLQEDTVLPAIGGVIRSGNLQKIEEGATIDTLNVRFGFDFPIPLNNININMQV